MKKMMNMSMSLLLIGATAGARPAQDFEPLYKYDRSGSYNVAPSTGLKKGTLIVIDTRDREACSELESKLNAGNVKALHPERKSVCEAESSSNPYNVVSVIKDSNKNELSREFDVSGVIQTERSIITETRNLFFASLGVAGALYMLPESVTKWDKNDSRNLGTKWKENVKAGPVVDKDDWFINYVGHPISGAAYYTIARGLDLSPMQAFGYSFLMSTFFWEYGVESFAETPSIQDIWSTPVLGALLGEVFFQVNNRIKANGGTVLGNERLGKVAMVLLDPGAAISNKINNAIGSNYIQSAKVSTFTSSTPCGAQNSGDSRFCEGTLSGLRIQFKH